MGYTIEFDSVNAILQCRFSGQITDQLLKAFYSAVREHAARTHPRAGIFDFTDATSLEVSPQTVRELAREAPAFPDVTVPRFVIAPSDYMFGMARMFQLLGEETRPLLHIVRTREEVYASLAIQQPRFQRVEAINPG